MKENMNTDSCPYHKLNCKILCGRDVSRLQRFALRSAAGRSKPSTDV